MASSASERAADLCILGGGIAGMLLAERALARGRRVLLIERGMPLTAQERLQQHSHDDPLPFNRAPLRLPHEPPPRGPMIRWGKDYVFWPVYNLGGCTNHFFGNVPRFHPSHFDQPAFGGGIARTWPIGYARSRTVLPRDRTAAAGRRQHRAPAIRRPIRLSAARASAEPLRSRVSAAVRRRRACSRCRPCGRHDRSARDRNVAGATSATCARSTRKALRSIPSIRRFAIGSSSARDCWRQRVHCKAGRVEAVTALDAKGTPYRIQRQAVRRRVQRRRFLPAAAALARRA